MAFHKKNFKDKDLLKKVLDTYNHYSDSQKEKNLSAPMVSTWINGRNWEHYETTPVKEDFLPTKKEDVYLKWVPWVKKGMRSTSIDQTMVQRMLDEKLITEEEYKAYV